MIVKHGGSRRSGREPEYNVWAKMISRCHSPKNKDYANYGARGIAVCDTWRASYAAFRADMGPRPSATHSIERRDNNKGYSANNCEWATCVVQARNRRPRKLRQACPRGHPMEGDNVYTRASGKRACKTCRRINMKDFYWRKRTNEHRAGDRSMATAAIGQSDRLAHS